MSLSLMENVRRDGWLQRLDPRVKFIAIIVYTIIPLQFLDPWFLLAFFILTLPFWLTARIKMRPLLPFITGMAIFFLSMFLVTNLYIPLGGVTFGQFLFPFYHEYFRIGPIAISNVGLIRATMNVFRLVTPLSVTLLILATTDPTLFGKGLRKLHFPIWFIFIALSVMRTFPLLFEQYVNISDAQTIRGVKGGGVKGLLRRISLTLSPLFITSLRRARIMGTAVECKGFGARKWNDFYETFTIGRNESIVLGYLAVFATVAFYLRFVLDMGGVYGVFNIL